MDLGHGVTAEVVHSTLANGEPVGLDYSHPGEGGARCSGFVYIDTPAVRETFAPSDAAMWTLERLDPITLAPSLACRRCGHHGFIRDGQWMPA